MSKTIDYKYTCYDSEIDLFKSDVISMPLDDYNDQHLFSLALHFRKAIRHIVNVLEIPTEVPSDGHFTCLSFKHTNEGLHHKWYRRAGNFYTFKSNWVSSPYEVTIECDLSIEMQETYNREFDEYMDYLSTM